MKRGLVIPERCCILLIQVYRVSVDRIFEVAKKSRRTIVVARRGEIVAFHVIVELGGGGFRIRNLSGLDFRYILKLSEPPN